MKSTPKVTRIFSIVIMSIVGGVFVVMSVQTLLNKSTEDILSTIVMLVIGVMLLGAARSTHFGWKIEGSSLVYINFIGIKSEISISEIEAITSNKSESHPGSLIIKRNGRFLGVYISLVNYPKEYLNDLVKKMQSQNPNIKILNSARKVIGMEKLEGTEIGKKDDAKAKIKGFFLWVIGLIVFFSAMNLMNLNSFEKIFKVFGS